jgi:hypothetical protein
LPIEKKELEPRYEVAVGDDGKPCMKAIPQWEINATGKEVNELEGIFKESAPQMMHDTWKQWRDIGEEKITKPDGSTDVVRADHLETYRKIPGFCQAATRPTFSCNVPWEGSMKRNGIIRQVVKKEYTETWYADGRKETVYASEVK